MSNDSWQYQGRQQHMWFGHGTAPKGMGDHSTGRSPVSFRGIPVHSSGDTANLIKITDTVGREASLCELPDGKTVPYIDLGDGYAAIPADAAGRSPAEGGFAAGRLLNEQGMPTVTKRGGVAGGGSSGPVTSPGSKILRELTGEARLKILRSLGRSASIGGSIARTFPYLGVLKSFLSFLRSSDAYKNAPVCRPIA